MRYQITEKVGPWINDAITEHGQGEDISWEHSLMPGPDGQPNLMCVFWLPGAVVGTFVAGSVMFHTPPGLTAKEVNETVAEFLRQMREARSQQIAKDRAELAGQNGHTSGQHPSGLILP